MPRHVNPTSQDRTATAPYNFVPLPERIFEVAEGIEVNGRKIKPWKMHDRFVPGAHSGWIDLAIETLTPLYIRGAVGQKEDGSWDERESRLRPDPYITPEGRPAIPGSSLRGMVRTLVEILSFSKIQPVSDARPFFRTVADDRIGRAYRNRMTAAGHKPRGGILSVLDGTATIEPREVVRVQRSTLQNLVQFQTGPSYTPPWPQQHGRCWVKVGDGSPDVTDVRLQGVQPSGSGWRAATLVLTGNAPRKKREFVFLEAEDATPPAVRVPDSIWARFHDEDQITNWQGRAFPPDRPQGARRRAPGHFRDGEPVFYLVADDRKSDDNPDGLVFLGRAGMFRFPYDRNPADLVPQQLRDTTLDLAEAMFGKVDGNGAIKGRVHFEDAAATAGGPPWCEAVLVPQILSAPKPTTFQHYLTQDGTKGKDQLTTYIGGDHTTIRGHKLYWHRWEGGSGVSQIKEGNNHDSLLQDLRRTNPQDTQHTIIRPVKAGVTFLGRIRFENLTDLELGALLHALDLPDDCCHRIGMGRPLGLGSVRITSRLKLVDRAARYRTWQPSGVHENEDGSRFRKVFEDAMLEHARSSGEALLDGHQGLQGIARFDGLFHLLAWANRPGPASTAYMDLPRFRDRPVLPTPHNVARAGEPPWRADPPRPAVGEGGGSGSRGGRPDRTASRDRQAAPSARPQRATAPATPKPGDRVEAVLLEERTKRGGWKAMHEPSGLGGPIQNSGDVPSDKKVGDTLKLIVAIASERELAFRFPTPADEERAQRAPTKGKDGRRGSPKGDRRR